MISPIKSNIRESCMSRLFLPIIILSMATLVSIGPGVSAQTAKQKTFKSPEEAVQTLITAAKANDKSELLAIFGPGSEDLVSSGDEVADKAALGKFAKEYELKHGLEEQGPGKMVLHVGNDDWPLPIPIVKKGRTWVFDTRAGKEEILNRRIGRNELAVIGVLRAYADAQREYAAKDRDANGEMEFAQKMVSTPGKHDGLYWPAKAGEEESPFGPLVAAATREGYTRKEGQPTPYKGYFYRILKGQGKDAAGGTYDYVVNGKMVLGFALVAYPAKYGSSGIMTFIVNQDGVVYQKDLGKDTDQLAKAMKIYDPDKSWKKVEEESKP
jgi:hypothetical protein